MYNGLMGNEDFYNQDYLAVYQPILAEGRTATEVDFLEKFAFDGGIHTVLDIPCGFGRHSVLLAQRGYLVHGIDSSTNMLEVANQKRATLSEQVRQNLSFENADMRFYKPTEKFHAVINLFTSFGYFDSSSNETHLQSMCNSVRSGGVIVLDIRNPIRDIIELSVRNWEETECSGDVQIRHTLDPLRMRHSLVYLYGNAYESKKQTSFRGYFLSEMEDLLARNDCIVEKTFGNFKGEPYTPETSRLIIVARRN